MRNDQQLLILVKQTKQIWMWPGTPEVPDCRGGVLGAKRTERLLEPEGNFVTGRGWEGY